MGPTTYSAGSILKYLHENQFKIKLNHLQAPNHGIESIECTIFLNQTFSKLSFASTTRQSRNNCKQTIYPETLSVAPSLFYKAILLKDLWSLIFEPWKSILEPFLIEKCDRFNWVNQKKKEVSLRKLHICQPKNSADPFWKIKSKRKACRIKNLEPGPTTLNFP